ncbi:trypsin-like serine peptidase [Streptomyces albireticuli]|uniref:trypsin-like serine peptidase n=1 Tax=Streptomyces albireticuli TaxID=1940 RepID=UPI00117F3E5C|nr:hypothetical protein [Streptomyces albireticuli]MCD9146120.1 hypothetical protein [Streptomyces albireticuli]MCD9166184.1 hypothetical protein [Streptomyces albireticuli]MCD9196499.1 hypothetical protein [Streptomyces albireticuli]
MANRIGRKAYLKGDEAKKWTFRSAWNSKLPDGRPDPDPYATTVWHSRRAWVTEAYANGGQAGNVAIIELYQDEQGRTIQESARGGLKLELDPKAPIPDVTVHGYPGEAGGRQLACRDSGIRREIAVNGPTNTRLRSTSCPTAPGSGGGPWADPATMRVLGITSDRDGGTGSVATETASPQFHELWNRVLKATRDTEARQPYDRPGTVSRLTGVLNTGVYCTASVLDSPSRTLIITAAHCLGWKTATKPEYSGEEVRGWTFSPASGRRPPSPGSVWQSTRAWVAREYTALRKDQRIEPSDFAIVELARNSQGRTIQDLAGGGLKPELNSQASLRNLTIHGYPGEAKGRQLTCPDPEIKQLRSHGGLMLESPNCYMSGGASGGPWADPATMRVRGISSTSSYSQVFSGDTTGPQFRELWNRVLRATS